MRFVTSARLLVMPGPAVAQAKKHERARKKALAAEQERRRTQRSAPEGEGALARSEHDAGVPPPVAAVAPRLCREYPR